MRIRGFLIAIALLAFTQTAFAQFNTSQNQQQISNRLLEMSGNLARQASDFAASNYRTYSNSFRSSRTEVEAIMLSEQFSGAAQVFYKMVNDRRRTSDLRDGFSFVQELARAVERNNLQRSTWFNIQKLLTDINREVDQGGGGGGGYPDQGQGRGGRITWKGRVDDNVRIVFRGNTADLETVGGNPYNDAQANFNNPLPNRRVNVTLTVKRGRGQVYIEEQPSRENNYACIIRLRDTKGGADNYEFELTW